MKRKKVCIHGAKSFTITVTTNINNNDGVTVNLDLTLTSIVQFMLTGS